MQQLYQTRSGSRHFGFADLKRVLACASSRRSGDELAGVAAHSDEERVAARRVLADLPLPTFLQELIVPYETDEVTRLIIDSHDVVAFSAVSHLTVGEFRDFLLAHSTTPQVLRDLARFDMCRVQMPSDIRLQDYVGLTGAIGITLATQSSDRRCARDRGVRAGWAVLRRG